MRFWYFPGSLWSKSYVFIHRIGILTQELNFSYVFVTFPILFDRNDMFSYSESIAERKILLEIIEIICFHMQKWWKIWEMILVIWSYTKMHNMANELTRISYLKRAPGAPPQVQIPKCFWYFPGSLSNDMFRIQNWFVRPRHSISLMFSLHSGFLLIEMLCSRLRLNVWMKILAEF